jgi:hypothetical protein
LKGVKQNDEVSVVVVRNQSTMSNSTQQRSTVSPPQHTSFAHHLIEDAQKIVQAALYRELGQAHAHRVIQRLEWVLSTSNVTKRLLRLVLLRGNRARNTPRRCPRQSHRGKSGQRLTKLAWRCAERCTNVHRVPTAHERLVRVSSNPALAIRLARIFKPGMKHVHKAPTTPFNSPVLYPPTAQCSLKQWSVINVVAFSTF